MNILAPQTTFAVGDLVSVLGDEPGRAAWRITAIVSDDPQHDGPYALLEDTADGGQSWAALRILRQQALAWAAAQLPSDDGRATYIGPEQVVEVHAPNGADAGRILAGLEQVDGQSAAVRLSGAADQPMTLAQAWQLAATLQALVVSALGGAR